MHMLANMSWGQWFTAMLVIVICAFLILVILLQRGRGGGLAGAFGGAGGSSAFGAKTGDVFTWITVVVAAGSGTNALLTWAAPDLKTTERGNIVADPETGQTSRPEVFAGGDVVTGAATVISAMGAGRRAAEAIDAYLKENAPA